MNIKDALQLAKEENKCITRASWWGAYIAFPSVCDKIIVYSKHTGASYELVPTVADLTAVDWGLSDLRDYRGNVRGVNSPIDFKTPLEDVSQAFAEAAAKPPVPQTERCGEKA